MKLRSLLAAALLSLGACSAASGPGSSPGAASDVLRGAEIRANGATDVYAAVSALRPGWLYYAVDSVGAPAEGSVLVFVDDRRVGDLRSLRGMRTEGIETVRLRGPSYVRGTTIGIADAPVTAGLYISTVQSDPNAGRPSLGRMGVYVNGGLVLEGMPASAAFDALDEAGYDDFRDETQNFPTNKYTPALTVQGGAWMGIAGPWRGEANVLHSLPASVETHSYEDGTVTGDVGSTEANLMISRWGRVGGWDVGIGAGPAVRRLNATWRKRVNQNLGEPESSSSIAPGAAAAATAMVRLAGPATFNLQLLGRRYAAQSIGTLGDQFDGIKTRQAVVSVTVGLGYELR